MLVPAAAIQIGQQGLFVFVVKPDSTAEQRPVVTGQRQDDMIVVDQGVTAGEQIITQGQMLVMPGGKVAIIPQPVSPTREGGVARDEKSKPSGDNPQLPLGANDDHRAQKS